MTEIALEALGAAGLDPYIEAIETIYQRAFGTTDDQAESFTSQQLARHAGYPSFSACVAFDGDQLVGFVYGYQSSPGHWWHDTVSPALVAADRGEWLEHAFEFVELAVDPAYQGQGVGGGLHDAVLRGIPYRTALLSTAPPPTNAMHLYRSRGWVPLIEDFRYAEGGEPAVLMGLCLTGAPAAGN